MTSSMRHAGVLALVLIAAGLAIFVTKTVGLGYPVTAGAKSTVWDFEIFLQFEGRDRPARIEAFIPTDAIERHVTQEQFYNGSFGLSVDSDSGTKNRKAVWTYRYPSNVKVLRYAAQTLGETASSPLAGTLEKPAAAKPFEADPVKRQAFIVWIGDLRRRSADEASFAALTFTEIFERPAGSEVADEMAVLMSDLPPRAARLELARQTLESQGIAARIASGVYLKDASRRAEIERWLEYRIGSRDRRYFPGGEPNRFLTIWFGPGDLVEASGIDQLDIQIGMRSSENAAETVARNGAGEFSFLNRYLGFSDLPLTTQLVYKVLVTIPIGITLLVFLRQFIGITTLGTFMPVLIGLAFRETALLNGLLLFTLLIGLGLTMRFYLERLHLLLVPRLAVVLIFIVICMAGITILMTEANQSIGLSISLFPMVIITMTIERMSIVWEETSAAEAIKSGAGSLAVASLAYLAMSNHQVEYLMYNFPELLLVLMGACVLMGRYTGLRLTELWRFRELAKS